MYYNFRYKYHNINIEPNGNAKEININPLREKLKRSVETSILRNNIKNELQPNNKKVKITEPKQQQKQSKGKINFKKRLPVISPF